MSATPRIPIPHNLDAPLPMTLPRLAEKKRLGEPIVMVTAYDFPSAQAVEEAGVDVVLVGDTAAMVVLGYDQTTPIRMDEMITMAAITLPQIVPPNMVLIAVEKGAVELASLWSPTIPNTATSDSM